MPEASIPVPRARVAELQAILDRGRPVRGLRSADTIETWSASFGDGIAADITVVNGDGPYVDAVLFDHGSEVAVAEPTWSLDGDWEFSYRDTTYRVSVRPSS